LTVPGTFGAILDVRARVVGDVAVEGYRKDRQFIRQAVGFYANDLVRAVRQRADVNVLPVAFFLKQFNCYLK
jgi:hypothetical protein